MLFDNDKMFSFGSSDITATATSTAVEIEAGTPNKGLAVRISVPQVADAGDTLTAKLTVSDSESGTYVDLASAPAGAYSWASGGKDIIIPFALPAGDDYYLKVVLTITGTAPNYGVPIAGVVYDYNGDWAR